MKNNHPSVDWGLVAGIATTLLGTVAPTTRRNLAESLSPFIAGAVSFFVSGTIMIIARLRKGGFRKLRYINPRYIVCCALPYLVFSMSGFFCTALAATREGTVIANLFNSLWALGGLIFTVPILKEKVTRWFPLACLLCVGGAAFGALGGMSGGLFSAIGDDLLAISFGVLVPISWGIYADYYCVIVRDPKDDFLPFLVLMSGVIQLIAAIVSGARVVKVDWMTLVWLVLQVLLIDIGTNVLWNYSMRSESRMTAILFANLAPVLTTIVSGLLLGVKVSWQVYVGAVIIAIGTMWAKMCFRTE